MELVPSSAGIPRLGRPATILCCSGTAPDEIQDEKHYTRRAGCESCRRLREMRETQATKEQSKPRRAIQACLHLLLLYREGQSSECMSQRELMSTGRRTPTQKESRNFSKGRSVPFETLPCALDRRHGMCGSPWIGPAGELGARGACRQ